jgi:hypothetical protein
MLRDGCRQRLTLRRPALRTEDANGGAQDDAKRNAHREIAQGHAQRRPDGDTYGKTDADRLALFAIALI